MIDTERLISEFVADITSGATEIYNEKSVQHELGFFLRRRLPGLKVQFERNVSHFSDVKRDWTKREMDIAVFGAVGRQLECAIEIKFPQNGRCPEEIFSFCEDIAFSEELVDSGF